VAGLLRAGVREIWIVVACIAGYGGLLAAVVIGIGSPCPAPSIV
jgi:hypothetical protein